MARSALDAALERMRRETVDATLTTVDLSSE